MSGYAKNLDFDSDTFCDMKHDMNFVLQRLMGSMMEKGSNEGSMTVKIDVDMINEWIPNYDPDIQGETRKVSRPQFKYKVSSTVKIDDSVSGNMNNELEMVMDDNGEYILRPVSGTQQRSMFDSDIRDKIMGESAPAQESGNESDGKQDAATTNRLTGRKMIALPDNAGQTDDEGDADAAGGSDIIDGEFREIEDPPEGPGADPVTDNPESAEGPEVPEAPIEPGDPYPDGDFTGGEDDFGIDDAPDEMFFGIEDGQLAKWDEGLETDQTDHGPEDFTGFPRREGRL